MSSRAILLLSLCGLFTVSEVFAAQEGDPSTVAERLPNEWRETSPWRPLGPAVMGGRITALAVVESDPSTFWVASASGGLLKTINNGVTFEHQFDSEEVASIGHVCVAPSDPDIVWVGTGEANPRNSVSWGNGVYRSLDGGRSWEHRGLAESFQIGRIAIHPTDPNIVYVGAMGRLWGPNEERGLYKTTDGGESWERVLYLDENTGVIDLQMHPTDPETLIAATYERRRAGFDVNEPVTRYSESSGLYRTKDGGQTFERLREGLPTGKLGRSCLDYYRSDPNIVVAIVESELSGRKPRKVATAGFHGRDVDGQVVVTHIAPAGAAARAGIQRGDRLVAMGSEPLTSLTQIRELERDAKDGDSLILQLERSGKRMAKRLVLQEAVLDLGGLFRSRNFSSGLAGQSANVQDDQQPDGFEHGGVFRSEDGGTSWKRVNSLNPRPMYFSQIRIDPSDDQRVYVCGTSLWSSSDGGESFSSRINGSAHPDHHALWVDSRDGRHLILGNDGGLYVTWDRGRRWDHHNHFAIGQFYHVAVGPRRDYWVYGGLQDNGTWGAPHRTPGGSGPVNQDWVRIGGGDGFVVQVDPRDADLVYYESQNGVTGRLDRGTGQRQGLRPRREGGGRTRFNWKTPFILSSHNPSIYYSAGSFVFRSIERGERLRSISPEITRTSEGSATALAESPQDPELLYVGTNDGALWARLNEGEAWIDRAPWPSESAESIDEPIATTLPVEVVVPTSEVLKGASNDAPAPRDPWEGIWDGELTSEDEGKGAEEFELELLKSESGWEVRLLTSDNENVGEGGELDEDTGRLVFTLTSSEGELLMSLGRNGDRLSGDVLDRRNDSTRRLRATRRVEESERAQDAAGRTLIELVPGPRWVSSIEPSRHVRDRVYLCLDGHRSDDDAPYVFVSGDRGETWRSIRANLPEVTTRVLREDIENENVLYLGTEFGAWVSMDQGASWTKLGSRLPTVAVHELAQHPASGEIVAATHGRSLWALDVSTIRQVDPEVLERDVHLFRPNDAVLWLNGTERGTEGDRKFEGKNPPEVLGLHYWLGKAVDSITLAVEDIEGNELFRSSGPTDRGLHRVDWNVQRAIAASRSTRRRGLGIQTGAYRVTLKVGDEEQTRSFRVLPDPSGE